MDHTWAANAVGTAPTKPTTLQLGYPTDTATPTIPGAYWFYQMTEEIRNVVVNVLGAGAPDAGNVSQLYSSIITLFNQATYTPTFINNSSGPSAIGIVASLERIPFGGAAQNGMAGELMFTMQDAGGNLINTNAIRSQWTDVTVGNRKSSLIFSSGSGNSLTDSMVLDYTGKVYVAAGLSSTGYISSTVTAAGAAADTLTLSNAGAGNNTKAQISFYANSTRYAGMAGGYGAANPEITWDIQGTKYLTLASTGLSVAGSVTVSTGLNVAGNGGFYNSANKFGLDNVAGLTRMYSSGANSSSRGSYDFRVTDSVGTLDMSAMTLSATGASVTGAFTAAGAKFGGSTYSPFGVSFLHDYNVGWTNSADTGIGPYLNSDGTSLFVYTNNIKRITVDSNGNIGHGISTSAWGQGKAIDLLGGSLWSTANGPYLNQNAYFGAASWYYINPGAASQYYQSAGLHVWSVAAYSATAGSPCTFTPVATLSNTGLAVSGVVSANNLLISGVNGATIGFGDVSAAIQVFNGSSASPNHIDFYTSTNKVTTIDSLGNLLIGVSTTSMQDGGKIVLGNNKSISHAGPISYFDTNIYYNGGDRYVSTGYATRQSSINGTITWSTYALGAAGASLGSASTMVLGTSGGVTLTNAEASITLNTTGQNAYSLISGGNGNLTNGFFGIRNNTAGTVPFTIAANSPANSVGITSAGLSVNGAITATAGITTTSLTTNGFSSTAGITNTSAANTNSTITLSGSGAYSSIINLNSGGAGSGFINTPSALFVAINGNTITQISNTGLAVSGALSTTSNITLNNATYFQTKNTGGTTGRLLGINSGNTVYVGDIDSIGNGTVNVVAGGVATINITASGASVSGTLSATGVVSGASASFTGNVFSGGSTEAQIGAILTGYNPVYLYSNASAWGVYSGTGGSAFVYSRSTGLFTFNGASTSSPAGSVTGTALAANVTSSSLTSVGTLLNLTVTNTISGNISGTAAWVNITYGNRSNSNFQLLWGSSTGVYGTDYLTVNASTGTISTNGGYSAVGTINAGINTYAVVLDGSASSGSPGLANPYGRIGFYGQNWFIGGDNRYGLSSNTGFSATGLWVNDKAVITTASIGSQSVSSAIYSSNLSQSGSGSDWNSYFQNTGASQRIWQEQSTGGPAGGWWFAENLRHSNSSGYWGHQNAWGWEGNANELYTRNVSNGIWSDWVRFLNSSNYNSYVPTLTGAGASGTWGINVTGNAGNITTSAVNYGSYGSIGVAGNTNGYAGISFSDYNATLMINSSMWGIYRGNNTWDWRVDSGTLAVGTVPWSHLNGLPGIVYQQDGTRSNADYNGLLSSGFYNGDSGAANAPNQYGQLITCRGIDTGMQIAGGYTSDNLYFRGFYGSGSGFTSWRTVVHSGNISSQAVSTAATLATSRTINGTSFDGSANITVTAAAGTLTGITLNSTVTASSLTSVGTLTNLSVGGRILVGNGSVSSPSFAFTSDGAQDTGFYWVSDGNIGIAANGAQVGEMSATGALWMSTSVSAPLIYDNGNRVYSASNPQVSITGNAATATSPAGGGSFITTNNIANQHVSVADSANSVLGTNVNGTVGYATAAASAGTAAYATSATTKTTGDSSTFIATTAFVQAAIGAIPGGVGVGQAWTDVISSRQAGTNYWNLTGKPIVVSIFGGGGNSGGSDFLVDGVHVNHVYVNSGYGESGIMVIVPNGSYYQLVAYGASYQIWTELR